MLHAPLSVDVPTSSDTTKTKASKMTNQAPVNAWIRLCRSTALPPSGGGPQGRIGGRASCTFRRIELTSHPRPRKWLWREGSSCLSLAAAAFPSTSRHQSGPSIGPARTADRSAAGMCISTALSMSPDSRASSASLARVGELWASSWALTGRAGVRCRGSMDLERDSLMGNTKCI